LMQKVCAEIDEVMGPVTDAPSVPDYEQIQNMETVRLCLAEALRLYPEPPILIRRCLEDVPLPSGAGTNEVTLIKGMDVFISVWNLHRHPDCWEEPLKFDPMRFKRPYQNPGVKDWAGYNPDLISGLYPNEVTSDFAFIPFGAGARKCIGDQFAMLEATRCVSFFYFRMGNSIDVVFFCLLQLFGDDAAAVQVRDDEGCERGRDGDGRDDSHRRRFAHEGVPSIGEGYPVHSLTRINIDRLLLFPRFA